MDVALPSSYLVPNLSEPCRSEGGIPPSTDAHRDAVLARFVDGLPESCRRVVTLRFVYRMSPANIATRLNRSLDHVVEQLAEGVRRFAEAELGENLDEKGSS